MVRPRKEKEVKLKLKQPDRSGPDPSQQTLLDIAAERGLLNAQKAAEAKLNAEEPLIGRLGESMFWSISLTMLHFTLDVLAAHQYAVDIVWSDLVLRTFQAFPGTSSRAAWHLSLSLSLSTPPPSLTPRSPG
jgi:hypothetical protein